MCVRVCRYDESVAPAVEFACGNAIVCDTLDLARKIHYEMGIRVKVATLDGTLIHKNGLLTGGRLDTTSTQTNAVGVGGKRRPAGNHRSEHQTSKWDDAEVAEVKKQRDQCQATLTDIIRSLKRLDADVREAERIHDLSVTRAKHESEIRDLERRLAQTCEALVGLRESVANAQAAVDAPSELSQFQSELAKLDSVIVTCEERAFANWCRRIGIASLRAFEEQRGAHRQLLNERRTRFTSAITSLANQIAAHEEHIETLAQSNSSAGVRLQQADEQLAEAQAALATIEASRAGAKAALDGLQAEGAALQKTTTAAATAVTDARRILTRASAEADRLASSVGSLEVALSRAIERRSALIRQCRVDEIDLLLTRGSLEDISLHGSSHDEDQMAAIVVNFTGLSREAQRSGDVSFARKHFEEPMGVLDADMKALLPKLRSADRLQAIEERLQASLAIFEETRLAAKAAREALADVRQRRAAAFMPAFEHISKCIERIYRELLFSSADDEAASSASAYLTLERSDEPYLGGIFFYVQVPGKRFTSSDALSGGERSLAALAFLFAMHSFRPAPFFILDEIDAALDVVNVARVTRFFARLVASASGNTAATSVMDESTNETPVRPSYHRCQLIIISLKPSMFEHADGLVGIYREHVPISSNPTEKATFISGSRVMTLRLTEFPPIDDPVA